MQLTEWLNIVLSIINTCATSPICLYQIYLCHGKQIQIIIQRNKTLLFIVCAASILFIGIYLPIHIIILHVFLSIKWWDHIYLAIAECAMLLTFVWREWHLYYTINLDASISDKQLWKLVVSQKSLFRETSLLKQTSFFIKYSTTLGRPLVTFKYFIAIPIVLLVISVSITMTVIRNDKHVFIASVIYLSISATYIFVGFCLIIYILIHTSHYRHILREIKLVALSAFVIVVKQVIVILCVVTNNKHKDILDLCGNVTASIIATLLIEFMLWINYHQHNVKDDTKTFVQPFVSAVDTKLYPLKVGATLRPGKIKYKPKTYIIKYPLECMLSNLVGLERFIIICSDKNLLNECMFLFEITQYLLDRGWMEQHIYFPDEMPKSTIVFATENDNDCHIFAALYDKYIADVSSFKIKISNNCISEASAIYKKCKKRSSENDNELLYKIQDIITRTFEDIRNLLQSSLNQYQTTPVYDAWYRNVDPVIHDAWQTECKHCRASNDETAIAKSVTKEKDYMKINSIHSKQSYKSTVLNYKSHSAAPSLVIPMHSPRRISEHNAILESSNESMDFSLTGATDIFHTDFLHQDTTTKKVSKALQLLGIEPSQKRETLPNLSKPLLFPLRRAVSEPLPASQEGLDDAKETNDAIEPLRTTSPPPAMRMQSVSVFTDDANTRNYNSIAIDISPETSKRISDSHFSSLNKLSAPTLITRHQSAMHAMNRLALPSANPVMKLTSKTCTENVDISSMWKVLESHGFISNKSLNSIHELTSFRSQDT